MNNEAKDFEKTTYPESGLTDYELEIEQLVDKIKSTERTLECIGLIRNFIERKSVGNNANLESAKCNKHDVNYCNCQFAMVMRDVNTDEPYCAECGKLIKQLL